MKFVARSVHLILELLRARDMYALEMVREQPKLKRGTIYTTLQRMEASGLVRSRAMEDDDTGYTGIPKRLWSITHLGTHALDIAEAGTRVAEKRFVARAASRMVEDLARNVVARTMRVSRHELDTLVRCDSKVAADVGKLVEELRATIREWKDAR